MAIRVLEYIFLIFCRVVCTLLRWSGPVPSHVAFIMDGNRRFAASQGRVKELGHRDGYKKMVDVVKWCLELGVTTVSVYAFSIENFKRSKDEVTYLMNLSAEKYQEIIQDTGVMGLLGHRWTTVPMQDAGLIAQRSLEVRLLGDLSLAPATVQEAAAGVVEASKQLKRRCGVLNIMFSYTSTHELARALATRSACVRANAARMDSENPPQHRSGGGVDAGVRDVAGHLVVRCASGLHGGEEGLGRACRVCRRMGGTSASHTACGHLEWCVAEGMGTGIRQRLLPAGPAGARNGVCPLSRDQLASCLEGARRDSHAVRVAVQCCHGASAAGAASARAGVGCCSLPRSPRPASSKPGHEGSWGGTQGLLEAVDAALLTAGSPPVDLLIRTSDESRLSDFLVWQCRGAQLAWVPELWPAFSFATFVRCILNWQMHLPALACIRRALACGRSCEQPV